MRKNFVLRDTYFSKSVAVHDIVVGLVINILGFDWHLGNTFTIGHYIWAVGCTWRCSPQLWVGS